MTVALIYPPTCDPTAPYLAVPTLTGWLRAHGVPVLPIDANLEGWEHLLTRDSLGAFGERIERRLAPLERRGSLSHADQLIYSQLWQARSDALHAPGAIASALATFRDPQRFYDAEAYDAAVSSVESAMRVVAAAHAPLSIDFVRYRTPFSLMNAEEIQADAGLERNPFHAYFEALAERIATSGVNLVGLSVAFPGQIQPAFSLAYALRRRSPELYITVGGPALTQMLLRLPEAAIERALGPFSSAVAYEGEYALLELVGALARGERPGGLIRGRSVEDMSELPGPDFDGLPLDRYLTPELVLPYDPTRGCYYGACTFCHYGLAEVGTARHRERPVPQALDQLAALSAKYGNRIFYFSQDAFAPRVATQIAAGIRERGLPIRWATDMRPERSLSPERARELVEGGALSAALGVESAAPRVLSLIDKGIRVDDIERVIINLSEAGMAIEAMCFSDFPTETYREALQTVRLVSRLEPHLSLFIMGQFDLTHGSLVAQKPGEFGIREAWFVEGDELKTGLFFQERRRAKSPAEQAKLEDAVASLSSGWLLRQYPWAGALSTAHTLLHYARFGKAAFRDRPPSSGVAPGRAQALSAEARFDLEQVEEQSAANEADIWHTLVYERRRVTRADYDALAARLPPARPSPATWRWAAGVPPARVQHTPRGRRPSHAVNSAKR
ncbi:MAG TPA: radical SAM protein [Polyangiaceae bacterium]|nr:radical SAM protein [Polyangiaceae bacterium]